MPPRGPLLALLMVPLLALTARPEDAPVAWRLGLSDVAVYDRRPITTKDGKERKGRKAVFTVCGHEVRDGVGVRPADVVRGDLSGILAMRLPGEGPVDLRISPRDVVPIRIGGTVEASPRPDGRIAIRSGFSFQSRGAPKGYAHWIRDGSAKVESVFDPAEGVVREVRIDLSYALGATDAKPGERSRRVTTTHLYALKAVHRARYDDFQKDVDTAIDAGVARLRALQKTDGSFPPHGNWEVGTTALAAFTLASCDVPRGDPALAKTLEFVVGKGVPARTYAQALCLMALDRAYTPAHEMLLERQGRPVPFRRDLTPGQRSWAREVADTLESGARSPGVWSYPNTNPRSLLQADSSNSQYAVLGMRAATRLGLPVKESTWLGVVRYFRQVRERDGPRGSVRLVREGEAVTDARASAAGSAVPAVAGFCYSTRDGHSRPWASMTCAGIASLSIAREQLRRRRSRRLDRKLEREIDEMILGGWAWLDAHWATDRHPRKTGTAWHLYYLYSLERAAVLSSIKRVGGVDWYFEGAVQLLARQEKKGGWKSRGGEVVGTCFALLFLKRATAPITPSEK